METSLTSSLSLTVFLFFYATFKHLLILVAFSFYFISKKLFVCIRKASVNMHAIVVWHAIQKEGQERKGCRLLQDRGVFCSIRSWRGKLLFASLLVCFQKLWCLSKSRTCRFPFVWLLLLCRHITALYCLTHKDVNEQVLVSRLMCQREKLCHVSLRGKRMDV